MFQAFIPIFAAAVAEHDESKVEALATRFGVEWPYFVSQVFSFAVVAFLLYRFAFKPVLATIGERQKGIAAGLRYAEEMKAKLADAEKQHAAELRKGALEAQKIIDEARITAKQVIERESQQATEKAQQIVAKAEEAIELDRRKIMAEARNEIARLVAVTAAHVLDKELTSDERQRYADSAAREMTEV